jgi:hypothetical protein
MNKTILKSLMYFVQWEKIVFPNLVPIIIII